MIPILDQSAASDWGLERARQSSEYDHLVRPIIEAVRGEGDAALRRYARELDSLGDEPFAVSAEALTEAAAALSRQVRNAAETAIRNIREFAQAQLPREYFREFSPGRKLGWIVRPLAAVGCWRRCRYAE